MLHMMSCRVSCRFSVFLSKFVAQNYCILYTKKFDLYFQHYMVWVCLVYTVYWNWHTHVWSLKLIERVIINVSFLYFYMIIVSLGRHHGATGSADGGWRGLTYDWFNIQHPQAYVARWQQTAHLVPTKSARESGLRR